MSLLSEFSCTWCHFHVSSLTSDLFIVYFACVLIGQSNIADLYTFLGNPPPPIPLLPNIFLLIIIYSKLLGWEGWVGTPRNLLWSLIGLVFVLGQSVASYCYYWMLINIGQPWLHVSSYAYTHHVHEHPCGAYSCAHCLYLRNCFCQPGHMIKDEMCGSRKYHYTPHRRSLKMFVVMSIHLFSNAGFILSQCYSVVPFRW